MLVDKRIKAHRKTMERLEAVVVRNKHERDLAVEDAKGGEEGRSKVGAAAVKEKVVKARRKRSEKVKKEEDRDGRVGRIMEEATVKAMEADKARVRKQDAAERMRGLVREVSHVHTKVEDGKRSKVLTRRREKDAAAQQALDDLRSQITSKSTDTYTSLTSHRAPRPELHPFQGKPARNIPRGHVRPISAAISRPAAAATPSPRRAPTAPVYYSFRVD